MSQLASSFHQLALYLAQTKTGREQHTRVAWSEPRNLLCGNDLEGAAREMTLVARASAGVNRPVHHMSVSWAPEDEPTREQMCQVATRALDRIQLNEHQSMLVAHGDEKYAHLHVMTNRVHPVTRRVQTLGLYYRKLQAVLRHAEREMGFVETPGYLYQLPGQKPPERSERLTKKAHLATKRRDELPFQLIVRDVAERDFVEAHSWRNLHERLGRHGLSLMPRNRGLVVTDGHEHAKCSSVAPNVSLRRLEARFRAPYEPLERSTLEHQTCALLRSVGQHPLRLAAKERESVTREFMRLDAVSPNLKARLGKSLYNTLTRLASHEREAQAIER